ncbi:MAG: OmpA family protein, partial [Acidobacteriota bacterium]
MAKKDITRRQHGETFTRVTAETHDFQLQPFQGLVLEVEDTHFHHDSAVLLPNFPAEPGEVFGGPSLGLSVIAECLLQQNAHPDATVLITGHADTSGPDQYNIGISIKRAKAVQHAIMGEREPWISIAEGQHKTEDYQLILTWVAMVYGWDCNPQGVDNVNGDNTKKAVKNFQERYNQEFDANIATDGKAGHDTWGAFFDVYMDMVQNLCETDEAGIKDLRAKMNFIGPKIVGCGENWPVEEPQRPNYRSQINRRVEILFFKSGQEPLLDCHPGGNVCKPVFCEIYNLKMYRFDYLPVKPSLPRPTQVFLKLQYLDPEGNEKLFPKDFPVTILYPDNTTQDEKVGDDGILRFGAQRKTSFTLKFESSETLWVAVSADDAASKLARKTDLAKLHKDKFRFFSTPKTWTLVESKWAVAANAFYKDDPEYKFYIPGRYGRTIGNGLTPVDMKLDPHWSFLRFEFFDRNYGHSDHNNKRVNIPATLISGWRNSPASGDPDATSHWTLNDADTEKAVHAIPWIIQKKPDNSDDPRPDKNIQFGLKTDWLHVSETAYVIAKSATERVVETRPNDHDDIKPAAKRLEFYDLPKEWISKKYYCRFTDNTGKFFDQAATFEDKIKASLKAPAQFLAFSLDDIVLTTAACAPVTLHAQDRVAVYFHRFEKTGDFPTTDAGLYNPDTGPNQSYYSLPQLNGTNYIFDYPNWTRLVIAQGNMFDVFSERVTSGDLIGARAGVMWVDAVAASPGAPDTTVADPPDQTINASRTDKKYFSIHPCFT